MPEPDGPTRTPGIGEGGSSVAVVAFQSNTLHDDDVLVTSGVSVDFTPPAQFACVPITTRPVGSALVFIRAWPAAGPVSRTWVSETVTRRL